jgi:cell division septal protein FtsQ
MTTRAKVIFNPLLRISSVEIRVQSVAKKSGCFRFRGGLCDLCRSFDGISTFQQKPYNAQNPAARIRVGKCPFGVGSWALSLGLLADAEKAMSKKSSSHKKPMIVRIPVVDDEQDLQDKPRDYSKVTRVRGRLFRPEWLFFLAVIVTGVFVGPRLAERLPDLTDLEEYRLKVENIHFTEQPHWVPHDLVQQVAKQEGWDQKPVSLLAQSCCQQIAEAFSRHPWVKKVDRVRLRPGAEVELAITFRKPVAMVEASSGKYYPIDAEAVLLPPADFSRADVGRYPTIINPSTMPQGPAGTFWGDIMVFGAARLADHLMRSREDQATHWEHLNLSGIELPQRTVAEVNIEDVQYHILTRDGSRIVWGRAPGTNSPGELSAEQKIGRLTQYLADFGTFRPPHGPLEIDIRHWQEITQRPLGFLDTSRN